MIKPTIGRQVLVYRGKNHLGVQWNPASIYYVHSDTVIDVAGYAADGTQFTERDIELRQDDIAKDATKLPDTLDYEVHGPFACWMPYQRKQASVGELTDLSSR